MQQNCRGRLATELFVIARDAGLSQTRQGRNQLHEEGVSQKGAMLTLQFELLFAAVTAVGDRI
jgi:hypothetical protein